MLNQEITLKKILLVCFAALVVWLIVSYVKHKYNDSFTLLPTMCPKAMMESRNLWRDHGELTRLFIVKYLNDMPGQDNILDKLMQNQEDIGRFIAKTSSEERGEQITGLLKEHINQAAVILKDAKNNEDIKEDMAKWKSNGEEIANAMASALGLSENKLQAMMNTHLDTTLDEAVCHIKKDHSGEQEAYRKVMEHLQMMADYLVSNVKCKCASKL
jgi:hypothetical protein